MNNSRRTNLLNGMKQLVEVVIRGAQSALARGLWWAFTGVFISSFIAFSLWVLSLAVSGNPDYSFLFSTFLVLSIAMVSTNLFVVFRSEQQEYDPWIDLRYHARIHSKISKDESKFLLRLHRTGYPIEMGHSDISTLNRIEYSVPNILLFSGAGCAILVSGLSVVYSRIVNAAFTNNDLFGALGLFVMTGFLFYLGIWQGVVGRWNQYRTWKGFWTSYWEYVLAELEPTDYASEIPEMIGSWIPFVHWSLWGRKFDLIEPKFLESITKQALKIMKQLGLKDILPSDTSDLISYLDCLALFHHNREFIKKNRKELGIVSESVTEFKETVKEMVELKSLMAENEMAKLRQADDLFTLLPVASLSEDAMREIMKIRGIAPSDQDRIRELARGRLETLWNLTESPIPASLKWTGLFYSIASLTAAWLSRVLG